MAKRLEKFSKREKRGLVTDSSIRNWVQREKAKKSKKSFKKRKKRNKRKKEKSLAKEKRGVGHCTDSSIRNWVQREKAKKQKCIEVSKGFSPLFLHFPYSKDFSCF